MCEGQGKISLLSTNTSSVFGLGGSLDTLFMNFLCPGSIMVSPEHGRGNVTTRPLWEHYEWSLSEACASGMHPTVNLYKNPWPRGSIQEKPAGTEIAGGHKFAWLMSNGDLEWDANELEMNHWNGIFPCRRCPCVGTGTYIMS